MSKLRRLIKSTAARSICQLSIDKIVGHRNGSSRRPLIICYHRVVEDFADASTRAMPSLLVSTGMFEKQLDWLAEHYCMVSIDEILQHSGTPDSIHTKAAKPMASITFDDGYADFYWNAFPILKEKGIPSSVFVVTDLVGTARLQTHDELYLLVMQQLRAPVILYSIVHASLLAQLYDILQQNPEPYAASRAILAVFSQLDLQVLMRLMREQIVIAAQLREELAPLDWDMLRTLNRQGVTIGSHTHTHALLPRHKQHIVERELRHSRMKLEDELGVPIKHLAYPDGQFDERIAASARDAGYHAAYAICDHQSRQHPQFSVPRQVLWQRACIDENGSFSPSVMRCLVSGVFKRAGECTQDHDRL